MQRRWGLGRRMRVELVRYILPYLLAGCAGGVVTAIALVATNTGSLRNLVMQTEGGWLGFALLIFGCAVTFGSVGIGHGIMSLAEKPD